VKRINAFDLINMCSGSAVGRLFQSEAEKKTAKTIVVPSSKPLDVVMKNVQVALAGVPGFVEQVRLWTMSQQAINRD